MPLPVLDFTATKAAIQRRRLAKLLMSRQSVNHDQLPSHRAKARVVVPSLHD